MADPYLGEIRMVGFSYAPSGWALCNGQQLSISQNSALFALLGTTYGGNGTSTFNLPDLQGRFPLHAGAGAGLPVYTEGQKGGASSITLLSNQLPSHTHTFAPACSNGSTPVVNNAQDPTGAIPSTVIDSQGGICTPYSTAAPTGAMRAQTTGITGSNSPLTIQNPYLAIYFIIALQGIFPPRP